MSDVACVRRILLVALGLLMLAFQAQAHAESDGRLLDPTRPQGWQMAESGPVQAAAKSTNALRLQGTFSLAGQRSAMISGQRVSVGDEVAGAEVIEINKNKVVLRVAGETVELASHVADVKSPSTLRGDRK